MTLGAFAKKSQVLSLLGPYAYEVDYFSEDRFEKVSLPEGQVMRAQEDKSYLKSYQRYLAYAAKSQIETVDRSIASIPAPDTVENLQFPVDQRLSIISFKRGELYPKCREIVTEAKKYKIKTIVYYHPVHYSGGNGAGFKMPSKPIYGRDWRYEDALAFSEEEFANCLNLISSADLRLHYVPHLESITTLVGDQGAEEWRLLSGIPIDRNYFEKSFSPLIKFLKKSPELFRGDRKLEITLAAEIDPMVWSYPREILEGKNWIKSEIEKDGRTIDSFYLNTNGDFFHGKQLVRKNSSTCENLSKLLSNLTALTPSMYGDKGHLKFKDEKLSLSQTINAYRAEIKKNLIELCPKNKENLEKILSDIKIGFGEFAVDPEDRKQSYKDILQSAHQEIIFVQYWNDGSWDHLNSRSGGRLKELRDQLIKPQASNQPVK